MFSKYVETNTLTRLSIVYFIVGLVALTKLEVFLAVALALPAGTVLSFHLQSLSMRAWVRNISICISSFLAPFILFYFYLCFHLSFRQALTSILSPWTHALGSSHLSLSFYQWTMGINAIESNLTKLFLYFFTGVAIIILITLISRFLIKFKYSSRLVVISMGMLSAGLLYLLLQNFPLLELLRPLPLITALFTVYYFTLLIRKKTSDPAKVLVLFSFSLFSFSLLLKIILNTHIYHYGFALTLPGTLLFIRWALYEYPNHKINNIGSADYYLATVLAFGLVIIASHVRFSHQMYQLKGFPVGSGRDVILDYYPELETRGPIVSETLKYVQEHVEPDAGIVPVPYGNMINYMTRHTNPIKFPAFNPLEARMVGEDTYLTAIKTASPQYIIFIDVDSSILGAQYFGVDYAQNIYQWVIHNYSVEKQFGETPFTGAGFGIQILRKNNEIAN